MRSRRGCAAAYNGPRKLTDPPGPVVGVAHMPSFTCAGVRRFRALLSLTLIAAGTGWLGAAVGKGLKPENAQPARATRAAWTSSRVVGSPDPPPPFQVVRVFPTLKFEHPLLITRVPGSNRI